MSEYYNIVPWYNCAEWHDVYTKIYVEPNLPEALTWMQIWKARCPFLPSFIESTLALLEVHLQDVNNSDDIAKDQFLRLAYSSAIMRFVNHMLDTEVAKGTSLYQAAQILGLPDWIIDLRHDTAHGNSLPSIELFREATQIGMNWLQKKYWDKYKICVEDFTTGNRNAVSGDDSKIVGLIHFCMALSVCRCSKINKLTDIPDTTMRESIISDTQDLFGENAIDVSNLKTVSITSLINLMNSQSSKIFKGKNITAAVNKAVLEEESLFLSLELLHFMSEHEFTYKNKLNKNYVQCFQLFLTFIHSNDLLLDLILELVHITQENDDKEKCLLAALWISEIYKFLKKSKAFVDKMKINSIDTSSRSNADLKSLYHHWFPNEKQGLLLDLQKSVPTSLLNIDFVKPIISSYNPYLTYFISDMLHLVEPKLPKSVQEKICRLASVISSPQNLNNFSSKIFTVSDLKSKLIDIEMEVEVVEQDDCDKEISIEMSDEQENEENLCSIWKISSRECDWAECPVGVWL